MASSITVTTTIWTIDCYKCGIQFGMPKEFYERRLDDHRSFFCPNGHSQAFVGETEAERLKRRLEYAKDDAAAAKARADQAEASLRATKGVVTKMRKRIGNGVCPCCKRTFKDLARHMESMHPGFTEGK